LVNVHVRKSNIYTVNTHTHTHARTHMHAPTTTHTLTHTTTLTGLSYSDRGRKKCVFRAAWKVVIVAAFLMCDGSEFQTEGPK